MVNKCKNILDLLASTFGMEFEKLDATVVCNDEGAPSKDHFLLSRVSPGMPLFRPIPVIPQPVPEPPAPWWKKVAEYGARFVPQMKVGAKIASVLNMLSDISDELTAREDAKKLEIDDAIYQAEITVGALVRFENLEEGMRQSETIYYRGCVTNNGAENCLRPAFVKEENDPEQTLTLGAIKQESKAARDPFGEPAKPLTEPIKQPEPKGSPLPEWLDPRAVVRDALRKRTEAMPAIVASSDDDKGTKPAEPATKAPTAPAKPGAAAKTPARSGAEPKQSRKETIRTLLYEGTAALKRKDLDAAESSFLRASTLSYADADLTIGPAERSSTDDPQVVSAAQLGLIEVLNARMGLANDRVIELLTAIYEAVPAVIRNAAGHELEQIRRELASYASRIRDCYEEAIRVTHDNLHGGANLGYANFLLSINHVAKAQEYLDRIIKGAPANAPFLGEAYSLRGQLAYEAGDFTRAIDDLQKAAGLTPETLRRRCFETYAMLGHSLLVLGDAQRAISAFEMALEYKPKNKVNDEDKKRVGTLYYYLGLAHLSAKSGRRETIKAFSEAIKNGCDLRHVYYLLATLLLENIKDDAGMDYAEDGFTILLAFKSRTYQLAEIEKNYREVLARFENDGKAHYNLGIVLAIQARTDEAIEHFNKASELVDVNIHELSVFADALAKNQHSQQALRVARIIKAKDPNDLLNRLLIVYCLSKLQNYEEAIKEANYLLSFSGLRGKRKQRVLIILEDAYRKIGDIKAADEIKKQRTFFQLDTGGHSPTLKELVDEKSKDQAVQPKTPSLGDMIKHSRLRFDEFSK